VCCYAQTPLCCRSLIYFCATCKSHSVQHDCDCLWLCRHPFDCLWLCRHPFDCLWLCRHPFDCLWLCRHPFDCLWLCRHPFDLKVGLPSLNQSRADERQFNSFWCLHAVTDCIDASSARLESTMCVVCRCYRWLNDSWSCLSSRVDFLLMLHRYGTREGDASNHKMALE